jgi:hypothetical protein
MRRPPPLKREAGHRRNDRAHVAVRWQATAPTMYAPSRRLRCGTRSLEAARRWQRRDGSDPSMHPPPEGDQSANGSKATGALFSQRHATSAIGGGRQKKADRGAPERPERETFVLDRGGLLMEVPQPPAQKIEPPQPSSALPPSFSGEDVRARPVGGRGVTGPAVPRPPPLLAAPGHPTLPLQPPRPGGWHPANPPTGRAQMG